ncbi:methyltransferase [Streptomyces chrestomyceticus JCM 4735]|uniref:Methyltransferase n=1 Tax=Streptomyces chrestomyceticus JCM 4735 TaxID=1306181 RepID=A0A7U9PZ86_9ACTN|nr:class I SAM-dependent methyltransferase [Streptomyces chrestomyceticus]GCD36070.1 methyltransferase [Streptomyces chrestomyceticus JCM 4735]
MRTHTGPEDWRAANRAMWDERVPLHLASDFYDQDGFRRDRDVIRDFEAAEVGDVTGKSLLHLQCHIGQDTLSWAHRGAARVVGLDFSEPAIEAARELAAEVGIGPGRATFLTADVYDAAQAVAASTAAPSVYDVVYTGLGALCWLPDIRRWAETAASLVAPGGFLYLAEFHPLTDVLDDESASRVAYDYFSRDAWVDESPGTYTDFSAPTVHNRRVEWQHTLGDVVSALAAAGLRLEFLHEHDMTMFQRFGSLVRGDDGYFRLPADRPRVPLMYSLKATRPRP